MRQANRVSSRESSAQLLDPRALRGIPGHLYILRNSALKQGLLHIGMSRRGGWAKALELNRDKSNLIPGSYECVFEARAQDSGAALEALWPILRHARQGNGALDFFEIDEASAAHLIQRCIDEADQRFRQNFGRDIANRAYRDYELGASGDETKIPLNPLNQLNSDEPVREGIFKKAFSWIS